MADDIFCKIIQKEIPADIVEENESWLAFKDIHPKAPVHILIVPKKHIDGIGTVSDEDTKLLGELMLAAKKIARKLNLEDGYRLILNQGRHGGQLVGHLHFHLLGGKNLGPKIIQQ